MILKWLDELDEVLNLVSINYVSLTISNCLWLGPVLQSEIFHLSF